MQTRIFKRKLLIIGRSGIAVEVRKRCLHRNLQPPIGKPVSINQRWRREETGNKKVLLGEHDRLHSGNFKALAATHVLASHHIVAAQHIGFRLGKTSAVSFVSAAGKLILLGAHQPADFVFGGLLAMRTVQRRHLLFRTFIKKFALFHRVVGRRSQLGPTANRLYYCTSLRDELWQDESNGKEKESEAIHRGRSCKDHGPRTDRSATRVTDSA